MYVNSGWGGGWGGWVFFPFWVGGFPFWVGFSLWVGGFPFWTQKIDIGAGGPFCTFFDSKNVGFYQSLTLVR